MGGHDLEKSIENIKLDQIWISHLSKNVTIKSYIAINMVTFFGSDQICAKWIKMDQIWIIIFIMRKNMVNIFGSDQIKWVKLD